MKHFFIFMSLFALCAIANGQNYQDSVRVYLGKGDCEKAQDWYYQQIVMFPVTALSEEMNRLKTSIEKCSIDQKKIAEKETVKKSTKTEENTQGSRLEYKKIIPLVSKESVGFGWDILIENHTNTVIQIDNLKIQGEVALSLRGYDRMHNRIQYSIILDSKSIDKAKSELKGAAFDEFDTEWGRVCNGNMDYINSTSLGKKSWSYFFEIPIEFQCPPKQLIILRLTFKYNKKEEVKRESWGSTPAYYQGGVIKDIHALTLFEKEKVLCTIPIDDEFLRFIANNEPKD